MSPLRLSMDYKAMSSPPSLFTLQILQNFNYFENVSKQEYHLWKQKSVSQPLLLIFLLPNLLQLSQQIVRLSQ